MDRIDFTRSINFTNFEIDVKLFFDQIMALYNLIGKYSGMDVFTESDQTSSIRFILLTNSDEEAEILYNAVNSRDIPIYGHLFKSDLTRINNKLIVLLTEEASG